MQVMESLTPDLVPAVLEVTKGQLHGGQAKLLRVLVQRWHLEMATVVRVIDQMADPRVFLDMTGILFVMSCKIV